MCFQKFKSTDIKFRSWLTSPSVLTSSQEARTDEDLAVTDDILKSVRFTADLPLRVRLEICKNCTHKQGAAGQELFKQVLF